MFRRVRKIRTLENQEGAAPSAKKAAAREMILQTQIVAQQALDYG